MILLEIAIPLLLLFIALHALSKGVDFYGAFLVGAKEGLLLISQIIPPLIALLTAISMVRASGALDALATFMTPLLSALGLPSELLPLMLIRPLSGSGALAVAADLLETHGPDSQIGRMASVMLGSTETTFYVLAVYFGATSITKTRYALPVALCADLTGFLMAVWSVRFFFP